MFHLEMAHQKVGLPVAVSLLWAESSRTLVGRVQRWGVCAAQLCQPHTCKPTTAQISSDLRRRSKIPELECQKPVRRCTGFTRRSLSYQCHALMSQKQMLKLWFGLPSPWSIASPKKGLRQAVLVPGLQVQRFWYRSCIWVHTSNL